MHAASPDYDVDLLATDPDLLSEVVRFDRPRLGAIEGLDVVHLQCHIGTDTVSLARLGASVTGLDFSPRALGPGQGPGGPGRRSTSASSSRSCTARADRARDHLRPGLHGRRGAQLAPRHRGLGRGGRRLLRPGGRLHLREGHPMLWSLDGPRPDGLLSVEYPYFEVAQPSTFDEPGTYVATDHEFVHNRTYEWNHGLGEIVTALLDAGLSLTDARRARLGAVGRAARDDGDLAEASSASATDRSACPTATPSRSRDRRRTGVRTSAPAASSTATGERPISVAAASARLGPCPIVSPSPSMPAWPTSA